MTYKAIHGSTKIGGLFEKEWTRIWGEGMPEIVGNLDEKLIGERGFIQRVVADIKAKNGYLSLVTDTLPDVVVVEPKILLFAGGFGNLKHSLFIPLDFELNSFKEFHGATIWLDSKVYKAVSRKITVQTNDAGGRPSHPAKAYFAIQGHQRHQGQTMKDLQAKMCKAVGKAPSESAIRAWEKEEKEKPK